MFFDMFVLNKLKCLFIRISIINSVYNEKDVFNNIYNYCFLFEFKFLKSYLYSHYLNSYIYNIINKPV